MENYNDVPLLKATHEGVTKIGDREVECAVLEDGTRLVARNAVFRMFGRTKRGRALTETRAPNLPSFFDAHNLIPFIDDELAIALTPFPYLRKSGREAKGYKAELIPLMCDAYLQARLEKALTPSQLPLAEASEILVRSLSKLSIVALIDEATGYQMDRKKDELQRILAAYISDELMPWQQRFPAEYYSQICRLKGWNYDPLSQKRPQLIGKITNDIVYGLLPEGVLEKLRSLNPANEHGHRVHKHHQFLKSEAADALEKHLAQLVVLMRISKKWDGFEETLCEAFPNYGAITKETPPDPKADKKKVELAIEIAARPLDDLS